MDMIVLGVVIVGLDLQKIFVIVLGALRNCVYITINFGRKESLISRHSKMTLINPFIENRQN
jgi:hypothetical protein